ncbi:hypothetical protein AV654_05650 [Paenibacillus elgii]|uniref:Uncharacterized protein n=2 Tax=Paenibacillus elgii TaxID=189691 RepID=A0A165PM78_9BACL|nr:hypothetical protein AV654_05650 [Paenibacillus elgii]NEN85034.1 hypothetical protein [Paenibacillus elgii]
METMRVEDVIDVPNRGLVLKISVDETDPYKITKLRNLIGSKIAVSNVDGASFELEVKDVSVSFSIANFPLIGLNIRERVDIERIKKGSKIHLL